MTRPADAIVVGGGVIGCAIARELARRGARTIVVERGEAGAEATRAAAGMVAPQAEADGPGPVLQLGVASRALYPAWATAIADESGLDVEYRADGIVYAATTPADVRRLARRAAWQRRSGLRVERWAPAAARRRIPGLGRAVRDVLWFPDDHRVNNERLGLAVALAARRAGVQLLERTTAHAVLAARGHVRGVRTDRGDLRAPVVVNAAGAWAAALALPSGLRPPDVFPVRGQIVVLRAPLGALPCPLYCPRGYLVPRADGRVLAGSTLERAGFEKRVTAGAVADILGALRIVLPGLDTFAVEGVYAGLRPGTADHRPLLGPDPQLAGLLLATGHYRSGILLAPATAVAIADLVEHGRTALPLRGLLPGRRGVRRAV